MPLAIIFVVILTMLCAVSVCQEYLSTKIDQVQTYSALAQTESDNAIEIARRRIARQLANHVEVADIQSPGAWQERRKICEGAEECLSIIENNGDLQMQQYSATPLPANTPVACSTPPPYDYNGQRGINECNLSLGGQLNEERRIVNLRTVVKNIGGHTVAMAERQVRFRVFRLAPYVQVVGIRDLTSHSSIKSVADIGGFDSPGGTKEDTLLRSYAPCHQLPESAPTPIAKEKYY